MNLYVKTGLSEISDMKLIYFKQSLAFLNKYYQIASQN